MPWYSATPRNAGPKSFLRVVKPTTLRSYACSLARSQRLAPWRGLPWARFIARATRRIYLDTAFFEDLQNKFGGCTDSNACKFSEAYVIAHEVGHHVQDELRYPAPGDAGAAGVYQQSRIKCSSGARRVASRLSRRYMGEAFATKEQLPRPRGRRPGLTDRLRDRRRSPTKRTTQGYVVPDAFTHGTSAQRKRWFMNGFNSGELSSCDTFSAQSL